MAWLRTQTLISAKIEGMFSLVDAPSNANHKINIGLVTDGWDSTACTWYGPSGNGGPAWAGGNGDPGNAGTAVSATWSATAAAGDYWEVDATSIVQEWMTGGTGGRPNRGVELWQTGNTGGTLYSSFYSQDAENDQVTYPGAEAMQLIIELVPEPATLGVLAIGGVLALIRRRRA